MAARRHTTLVLGHLPAQRPSTTLREFVKSPRPSDGNETKEHPISSPKLLAATAFALIALGTPLAQAASAFPPGPTAQAASAFPPGPSVAAATAYPPGPTKSIIAI